VNAAQEIRQAKRRAKKPVMAYFVIRRLIDPQTGAEVGCLVPASKSDRAILRDRGLKTGDRVRHIIDTERKRAA
jgi:ribosomal protein L2